MEELRQLALPILPTLANRPELALLQHGPSMPYLLGFHAIHFWNPWSILINPGYFLFLGPEISLKTPQPTVSWEQNKKNSKEQWWDLHRVIGHASEVLNHQIRKSSPMGMRIKFQKTKIFNFDAWCFVLSKRLWFFLGKIIKQSTIYSRPCPDLTLHSLLRNSAVYLTLIFEKLTFNLDFLSLFKNQNTNLCL